MFFKKRFMRRDVAESTPDWWMFHMRRGEFEDAWRFSDKALELRAGKPCWHLPRHLQHIWNGSSLEAKRVLVRCYHGLGDTIQFIRYAPLVKGRAASLTVWAQPQLIPLLKSVPEIDLLLPLHDGSPDADFEVDVEIMELPHIFRTRIDTIPATIPYLFVDPQALSTDPGLLSVGLVWKAGDWDDRRSISFSLLKPVFEVRGTKIFILQGNAENAGWDGISGAYPGEFDLEAYARTIAGLDLLITVDSMPAHLAGALGVPVWTLLHAKPDWRWMEHVDHSPWYPSMRLYRQEHAGDWQPVIERVTSALQHFAARER
jgi:hypothetical protein